MTGNRGHVLTAVAENEKQEKGANFQFDRIHENFHKNIPRTLKNTRKKRFEGMFEKKMTQQ